VLNVKVKYRGLYKHFGMEHLKFNVKVKVEGKVHPVTNHESPDLE
jgi:hypothetical protein